MAPDHGIGTRWYQRRRAKWISRLPGRESAISWRFIYAWFVRPWPAYAVALLVIALLSAAAPSIQLWSITHIVAGLTAHHRGRAQGNPLIVAEPYLGYIALFAATLFITQVMIARSTLLFFSTHLEERIRGTLYRQFLVKTMTTRLADHESAKHMEQVSHVRAVFRRDMSIALMQLGRFVALTASLLTILVLLGLVGWEIPVILLPATFAVSRVRVRMGSLWSATNFEQAAPRRGMDYWESLLTERRPASEVRLLGLQDYIAASRSKLAESRLANFRRRAWSNFRTQVPLIVFLSCFAGVAFFMLLEIFRAHHLPPGSFVAYIYLILQFEAEIEPLGTRLEAFVVVASDLARAEDYVRSEPEERVGGVLAPSPLQGRGLRLCNVSFKYPDSDQLALRQVSFGLKPGEKLAIVGENGAGKTTLVKVIAGLYEPTSGEIFVDDTRLTDIDPVSWRDKPGFVMQDFMRYNLTARENIGLGRISNIGDRTAIETAAVSAGAAEFIGALPRSYDTQLGKEFEESVDLSQGQWQRLAIARGYFRQPELIVLDEPSSALDPIAEMEVYQRVLALSAGRTVIFISHRLGAATLADKIVYLAGGSVREIGSHAELMELDGGYAALYRAQAQWYQPEEPARAGESG